MSVDPSFRQNGEEEERDGMVKGKQIKGRLAWLERLSLSSSFAEEPREVAA